MRLRSRSHSPRDGGGEVASLASVIIDDHGHMSNSLDLKSSTLPNELTLTAQELPLLVGANG